MSSENSRFQHLLQPIRDLSKNWSIDLAQELEEYLDELEGLSIAFDASAAAPATSGGNGSGAAQLMNFAEAALLIQGTSMIYSRKVEYLYALVFQTLAHLSKQQSGPVGELQSEEAGSGGEEEDGAGGGKKRRRAKGTGSTSTMDVWANPLPIYDEVEEAKNITLKPAVASVSVTSVNATPRKTMETVKSKNNVQASIALMGSLVPDERDHGETFKLLSCHLHPSGVLLMDDASKKYLKDEMQYVAETPAPTTSKRLQHTPMAKLNFEGVQDDGDDYEDNNEPMDDNGFDYGGGGGYDDENELPRDDHETTDDIFAAPMVKPEPFQEEGVSGKRKVTKTSSRAAAGDAKDPWASLDPYDASKSTVRPFRKGRSYPVRSAKKLLANKLKQEQDETDGVDDPAFKERFLLSANRPQWSTWVWNDLDERALEQKFKKKYCKAPCLLTSCEPLWKLETKWKSLVRKSNAAEAQSAQAILIHEEAEEEEEMQLHSLAASRMNDAYVSDPMQNADANDDNDDDDDLDNGMDYGGDDDWDNHNTSAMAMLDASMVLKNGGFGSTGTRGQDEGERALSYEEICRQHLEDFMKGTEKYIRETDLSRQVNDWQDKLNPILQEQDAHPPFDIHRCGREIIGHLESSSGGKAKHKKKKKKTPVEEEKDEEDRAAVPFSSVVGGLHSYEVCRMFLASLQLANNGNVQLHHGKTAADQTHVPFEMQLLTSSNVYKSLQV